MKLREKPGCRFIEIEDPAPVVHHDDALRDLIYYEFPGYLPGSHKVKFEDSHQDQYGSKQSSYHGYIVVSGNGKYSCHLKKEGRCLNHNSCHKGKIPLP